MLSVGAASMKLYPYCKGECGLNVNYNLRNALVICICILLFIMFYKHNKVKIHGSGISAILLLLQEDAHLLFGSHQEKR